jgi:hypothetical protein
MNLNQLCLYHGLPYSSGTHLNCFTIVARVGSRYVHVGITDNEKKPKTKKSSRRANHYHLYCQGSFGPCTVLMTHMDTLLGPIILDTPTDWDTVTTWPVLPPGTIVPSVSLSEALNATPYQGQASAANAASSSTFVPPLVASVASLFSEAFNATSVHGLASDVFVASSSKFVPPPFASVPSLRSVLASEALHATLLHAQTSNVISANSPMCVEVHAHASDANASVSSTFVAPPVSVDESLVPVPMSAAGEDLELGRSVFVGLVLRRCCYLAVTWQFTALQLYMVSRSYGAHLSHLCLYKDLF